MQSQINNVGLFQHSASALESPAIEIIQGMLSSYHREQI